MYQLIYDALLGESALPDANGNPVLAEGNVQAWFGAAVEANRGEGASSTLIRVYTQAQIELRSGQAMTDPQGQIQAASNAIAQQVFDDIAEADVTVDGQVYYAVPSVLRIGNTDAAEAVDNLANFDPSMWSGNPLFIGLGLDDFWIQNLLGDTSNTYDVFAAIEALRIAGFETLNEVSSILDQFTNQGSGGLVDATSALGAANAATRVFLDSTYDLGEISLATLSSSNVAIGSDNFDGGIVSNGFSSDTFMLGGLGNDTLVGSIGTDILDGGAGEDSVGFEDVSQFGGPQIIDLTASIFTRFSDVQFAATVVGQGIVSQIYDVEGLTLGLGDDVLEIQRLTANNTSLTQISGSGNGQHGDTIDFSDANRAATASLKDGTATLAETSTTLEVFEFENLIGSAYKDVLEGDDAVTGNKIDGRGGKDEIDGKGGNDYLRGGNGWDKVRGGEGDDIIEAGNGGDRTYGDDGDDLIFTNAYNRTAFYTGDDRVWAGAGNDIIIGDDGVDIIKGQGGHDILIGGSGADTLEGQWGKDYIITEGADNVRGGFNDDWINGTAFGSDAIVFFGADDGHDHIEQAVGFDNGIAQIVFEGLSLSDVELHWNSEITERIVSEDVNGNTITFEAFSGDAYVEVIGTGATINIGTVEGTLTIGSPIFDENGEIIIGSGFAETRSLSNRHSLVFTDGQVLGGGESSEDFMDITRSFLFDDPGAAVPAAFDAAFASSFVDENTLLSDGATNLASILSQDTIAMLTDDVFAMV